MPEMFLSTRYNPKMNVGTPNIGPIPGCIPIGHVSYTLTGVPNKLFGKTGTKCDR
jgi:hypothetical protein